MIRPEAGSTVIAEETTPITTEMFRHSTKDDQNLFEKRCSLL